jgi:hypothetical protein
VPTAGEGDRLHGTLSALVTTGIEGGFLTNPRLAMVHWQPGNRPVPAPRVTVSGESVLWVDPAEIPSDSDIGKLGRALVRCPDTLTGLFEDIDPGTPPASTR